MRKTVILWVIGLVAAVPVLAACGSAHGQTQATATPATSTLTPNAVPTASPTPMTRNGLKLSFRISSSELKAGQGLTVTVGEENTLATSNNVSSAKDWPIKGLEVGPCGTINYPMGVAIFQGYYTSAQLSKVTPPALQLNDPNAVYHCPDILSSISGYDFQPSSDVAGVSGSCTSNPCLSDFKVNTTVTAKGYWSAGQQSTFSDFAPGEYTVAAGDEWGSLEVLHFTVNGP